ncbi:MAG: HAAS signaling domain-containing protein [Candidatus Hodarchaeales archaeon]
MKTENEKLVENFLKKIEKHLPEWLKSNKEKLEDVLLEISSHIWDSAQEIAGPDETNSENIRAAINRLGNPKEIARSYKKRGTPRYFISEELWSIFTKAIISITAIIFLVILIVQVVLVEPNNLLQALINGITTSYPIIITVIVIIIAIFVGLSYEGYFPKDLIPENERKETKTDYYKPDEFLFNGIAGIIFGLLFITMPIDMINLLRIVANFIIGLFGYSSMPMYATMSSEVHILMTIMGIVTVIAGIVNLLKMRTKDIGFQLIMNTGLIFTGIVDFGLTLYILANLHIFSEVLPLAENILLILLAIGILGAIVDIGSKLSKNIKLYGILEEKMNYQSN